MSYRISSPEGAPLLLIRRELGLWIMLILMTPISLVCFLASGLFVAERGLAGPAGMFFGLSLIFCAALLSIRRAMMGPRSIRFDNEREVVELSDDANQKVSLSYLAIERFSFEERVMYQRSRSKSRRCVVSLHKRDGARWVLYEGGSVRKSKEFYQRLLAEVSLPELSLDAASEQAPSPAPPMEYSAQSEARFTIEEREGLWTLSWHEETPLRVRIGLGGLLAGLILIGVSALNSEPLSFGMILIAIFAGLLAPLLARAFFKRDQVQQIQLSSEKLCAPRRPTLFNRSELLELPLDEIAELSFSFGGSQSSSPLGLQLFSAAALEQFRGWQSHFPQEPGELLAVFRFFTQLPTINPGTLSYCELVRLELLLQERLSALTGRSFF